MSAATVRIERETVLDPGTGEVVSDATVERPAEEDEVYHPVKDEAGWPLASNGERCNRLRRNVEMRPVRAGFKYEGHVAEFWTKYVDRLDESYPVLMPQSWGDPNGHIGFIAFEEPRVGMLCTTPWGHAPVRITEEMIADDRRNVGADGQPRTLSAPSGPADEDDRASWGGEPERVPEAALEKWNEWGMHITDSLMPPHFTARVRKPGDEYRAWWSDEFRSAVRDRNQKAVAAARAKVET